MEAPKNEMKPSAVYALLRPHPEYKFLRICTNINGALTG